MEGAILRTDLEHALEHVEGWLLLDEAWALYHAVRALPDGVATVVEIGSWKGRSTIALALAVKARGCGQVFAIDPHTGERDRTGAGPVQTLEDFQANVARAGVDPVVEVLLTTSQLARSGFADQSVDLLFVDGSHQYPDVKRDIDDWVSALKDRAVIAFNDPAVPGVYRALRELVLRPGPFAHPRLVQNTLFFDFGRLRIWQSRDKKALQRLKILLWLKSHAARFSRINPPWLVRAAQRVSAKLLGP